MGDIHDAERYVLMACRCGADWIEDRLELEISCPSCAFSTNWKNLPEFTDVMAPMELREIDFSPSQLNDLLERAGFEFVPDDLLEAAQLSRHPRRRWTHLYSQPTMIWEITIEATAFRGEDKLRSVSVAYRMHGIPALLLTVVKGEDLIVLLAAIARAIELATQKNNPLGRGVFCASRG